MNDSQPILLRTLVAVLGVLALSLVGSLLLLRPSSGGERTTLDEVHRLVGASQVAEARILDHDSRVVVTTTDGQQRWAAYPDDGVVAAELIADLSEAGATVDIDQQSGKETLSLLAQFILPLLLLADLFGIFILLARGGSGQVKELFAFSRLAARRTQGAESNPHRFSDVAAADDAVAELSEIADYLRDPSRFARLGARPPKGVLLTGPPGCGKTLLAKALAGEVGVPFYSISGSEFVESLVGVGAARVRDLFRQAVATAPALVFIDELDAAGRARGAGVGGGNDEREQTLNEMLVQMDGFAPTLGVVVIGATNRPDILDPALLRPGRFDRHVTIEAPDVAGREEILGLHAGSRLLGADVDFEAIARITPGFSGADLANVVNEAALLAVRRGANLIEQQDLDEGVQRVLVGPRRRGRLLEPDELERLAWHEAGHAVVADAVDFPAKVERLSLVARGRHAAHTDVLPKSDRVVVTQGDLLAELTIIMAGVAAEMLECGEPSTAGEIDLERATELARRFAGRYGMSEQVGRIRILEADQEVYLGRALATSEHVSATTMEAVDQAVRELVDEAEERALQLLQQRRRVLAGIAEALLEYETLGSRDLAALLAAPARSGRSRQGTRKAQAKSTA